ncbi:SDR family oxidoreductase [Aliikangiella marina]|uniref:SDR family oxidoreductase n=1 Tax=Aliikangiella marina TaxID=1712262 RepID=A0A545T7E0_9GAMM|nr:SDR family oxidoreductase [Aliikangiella marina]TQV73143.1 SDR family oxidoreductase [Aliikangiella marina]
MNIHWKEKVILITGAGSGIGQSLARLLASLGGRLIITDKDATSLTSITEELAESIEIAQVADVSNPDDWQALYQKIDNQIGYIDVLVNNAGMSSFGFFDETAEALFDQVMAVNFQGVVYGCRYSLPLLEKSSRGLIVNVASIFGLITVPMMTPYHSSKFAVKGFSEALKHDLKYQHKSIDVICVMPGGIKTNIAKNTITTERENAQVTRLFDSAAITTPEQAAIKIEQGMRNLKFRRFIGIDAKIVDKLVRWFPNSYYHLTNRLMGLHGFLSK